MPLENSKTLYSLELFYGRSGSPLEWRNIVASSVLLICPFPMALDSFIRISYNLHLAAAKLPFLSTMLYMK